MTIVADRSVSGKTETEGQLHRAIDWRGAFWVASGVPALVLFSIGGVSGVAGNLAFLVWTVSIIHRICAVLHLRRNSRIVSEQVGRRLDLRRRGVGSLFKADVAPLSVWCNWIAWSPVLALGCSIAAAYILNAFAPVPLATGSEVAQWLAAHGASVAGSDAG